MGDKINIPFVETSAKDNHNISKVFEKLAIDIIESGGEDSKQAEKGKKITNSKKPSKK